MIKPKTKAVKQPKKHREPGNTVGIFGVGKGKNELEMQPMGSHTQGYNAVN